MLKQIFRVNFGFDQFCVFTWYEFDLGCLSKWHKSNYSYLSSLGNVQNAQIMWGLLICWSMAPWMSHRTHNEPMSNENILSAKIKREILMITVCGLVEILFTLCAGHRNVLTVVINTGEIMFWIHSIRIDWSCIAAALRLEVCNTE